MNPGASIVYHAATADDWATRTETFYQPAGYAAEGFVHCSTAEQLTGPLHALFLGRKDLILLTIESSALTSDVIYEDLYDAGEDFPHIYGPVDLEAVVASEPIPCDEQGRFDHVVDKLVDAANGRSQN
jgi:uncharacterized protein (DUF952 family)